MQVRISTISYSGLPVEGRLGLEAMNARLQEGRASDIQFVSDAGVSLVLTPLGGGAIARGTVTTRVKQGCGACDKEIERELVVPIDWSLRAAREGQEDRDLESDDVGIYFYRGDHIDLESPLMEAVILQLSPFWRPEMVDGKCSACGREDTLRIRPAKGTSSSPLKDALTRAIKN